MGVFQFQPATVLRFTGEDHREFLQSQGTADLRGPAGLCRHSLWLDFRGNIHGDAFVLRESDDACLLVSYATPVTALREKFQRHIIADDVEMEDLTPDYIMLSMPRTEATAWLSEAGLPIPDEDQFATAEKLFLFHGRRLGPDTLDLLAPVGDPPEPGLQNLSLPQAETMRLQAAMPLFPGDADCGELNPVETNSLHSVSFEKGCFLGQEVVARVHRLQRVAKRLVLLDGATPGAVEGQQLTRDGTAVGKLTSVVEFNDKILAIGWLKSKIPAGEIVFDEGPFTVRELPVN